MTNITTPSATATKNYTRAYSLHPTIVTAPWSRYLGEPFVLTDLRVRVFESSGLIDRKYEILPVWTILLSG